MPDKTRSGKELILATKPYTVESRGRSWFEVLSTFAMLAGLLVAAAFSPWWPVRAAAAALAGLTTTRFFILYHDFMHGALLRKSLVGKIIMYVYGVLVVTPPNVWRQTHNYHHAHTAKLVGSHVGSYAMMSLEMWAKATPMQKLLYRIARHPVNILIGYLTIFLYGMCLNSFLRNPRKNWDSLFALVLNIALSITLAWTMGFQFYLFVMLIPLAVACATGGYLFYAQHNFPDIHVQPRDEWSYTRAALESSSYMRTGPILRWFTGNIGYHHVHHLNSMIPFYRLPEVMAAMPELQHPPTTSLMPWDIWACFKLKLWDAEQEKMVGYP